MDNSYLFTIISLAALLYFFQFYNQNKDIIVKIKGGIILYILQFISGMVFVYLISFWVFKWWYILFFLPGILASIWLNIQVHKKKNSIQSYIYLGCFYSIIIVAVIYNNS